MVLSRLGRFLLGMYSPFAPDDLRLTEVESRPTGLSQIVSRVGMAESDRRRQEEYQRQQHEVRDTLQESMLAREIEEGK